jgi:hypothetical protein
MLMPNGPSVMSRHLAISSRRPSGVSKDNAVMNPMAPALATAEVSSATPTTCRPPCTIGCSTPNNSVILVVNMAGLSIVGNPNLPEIPARPSGLTSTPRLQDLETPECR